MKIIEDMVESINETIIRTKLEGMIKKIFVEEGDKISKGDLLAVYDDDFYQNKYTKAKIALKETESRLRNAEKKTSLSERIKYDPLEYKLTFEAKQTDYEAALINYRAAKREYDAAEELLKSKIVSRLTVDKRRDELEKAEALLAQAKKNLEDAKKLFERREQTELNIHSMETERQQITLERKKAIEDVRYWKTQIEKLNIIAPHNGVVIKKAIEDGMLLDAGMEIVTIADIENLRIVAEVDEVDAGRINIGMHGVVTFDAFPNKELVALSIGDLPIALIKIRLLPIIFGYSKDSPKGIYFLFPSPPPHLRVKGGSKGNKKYIPRLYRQLSAICLFATSLRIKTIIIICQPYFCGV